MATEYITVTDKDGEVLTFGIESDPNWVADSEYQDEDGNWISDDDENEEQE